MKQFLFILALLMVFISAQTFAQVRTLPANIDTNTVNPEEIPGAEKLKAMGASDDEVKLITEFKQRKLAQRKQNLSTDLNEQTTTNKPSLVVPQNETNNTKPDSVTSQQATTTVEEEKIYGQGFFNNSNLKFYNKANQLKAPENYILGVGDEINIAIWGYSDYNDVFKIDENGAISPRLIGRIYLNGLTFKEAKGLIASKFKSAYDLNNSQIDVTLAYSKIITVNVVGEVKKPGAYTLPAVNTAFNVLSEVGGIKSIGSVRKIYVKRGGQTVRILDIYEYLMNPDSKQDFFLENNDYILVPPAGRVVKISGQVKRATGYELSEKDNLKSLIEFAGGFEVDAYRKRIQIKRFLHSSETIIDVDYDSLMSSKKDFELFGGDEIMVRKIQSGYNNYVEVLGAVKLPGNYELKPGDKILDVLNKAEGLAYDVFDSRAYVIRLNPDLSKKYIPFNLKEVITNPNSPNNIELKNQDLIKVFSKTYFKDEFTFSVLGAVRKPDDYTYATGITLKDALYMAGGIRKEAAKNRIEISRAVDFVSGTDNLKPTRIVIKTIQIGDDLKIDKSSEEFLVQPYDQIMVRTEPDFELQKNVYIRGEVVYPGTYSITSKNEKLTELINRAGGLTPFAFTNGATLKRTENNAGYLVLKLNEVVDDSNSVFNYIVKGGDTLTIPKLEQLIKISGNINYPGIDSIGQINAPFIKGKSAKYYIKNYGLGFSKSADKKGTYLKESGGYAHRTKHFLGLKFYPKVEPGSLIVVPSKKKKEKEEGVKKEPVDWNKTIENLTVKLTAVATLYVIISKLK